MHAWVTDPSAAATYGHISTWDVSAITDMSYLFCGDEDDGRVRYPDGERCINYGVCCNEAAQRFNDDNKDYENSLRVIPPAFVGSFGVACPGEGPTSQ